MNVPEGNERGTADDPRTPNGINSKIGFLLSIATLNTYEGEKG